MKALRPILLTSFLFFAHLSVVMYVNSTVLEQFVSVKFTSIAYVLGAAGSVVLLFLLPKIVQRFGLVKTAVTIFTALAITLLILGTTGATTFVAVFICYTALSGTVWYCNDLFVSHYSEHKTMGHARGTYLTIINAAIAIMPIIAGYIVERKGFGGVYLIGAGLLSIAAIVIFHSQQDFVDRPYTSTTISLAWEAIRQSPALRRVISINFALQFFYVWMTIFTPIYMVSVLHFSWQTTGIAFTGMLTAFVILQYPIGKIADRIGEKYLLITGFAIAALSTVTFALLQYHTHALVAYTVTLFFTRVGICMVEVLSETYFFKQITDRDEGIVSVYRMMYPLAYIIAPLLGWIIIANYSYVTLFITLGALLFVSMLYCLRLVEIR